MPPEETLARLFDPEPASAPEARRFVTTALREWGRERFDFDAALCTDELSANAILHSRTSYTVSVRPLAEGVRLDVLDGRPDQLPVEIPVTSEPLMMGTTGRGLVIVANLASRWGYFNTDVAKTVWVELDDQMRDGPSRPLIELTRRPPVPAGQLVRLVDVPVAAAVASGVQVDDLVRAVQLDANQLDDATRATFFELMDRTAAIRLIGRHMALRAAGEGETRFTIEVAISADDLAAMTELAALLDTLPSSSPSEAERAGRDVTAMRVWLAEEVTRQHRGEAPTPYLYR